MDSEVDDELLELETNALLKENENINIILDDNVDDVEMPEECEKSSHAPTKTKSPLLKQARQCFILIRKNIWIFVSEFHLRSKTSNKFEPQKRQKTGEWPALPFYLQ